MNKVIASSLIGLCFSLPVASGTTGDRELTNDHPFYVGAYGGYGSVSGGYKQDGDVAMGRLALGIHAKEYKKLLVGAELGIQSGNIMRLNASSTVIETAGGLPIQATLNPLIDLLFTVKGQFKPESSLFYVLKGGIAYRQLRLNDRISSQDSLNKVNGEFQAGLGYNIVKNVMITAFYQGIYSSNNSGVGLNAVQDVTISHIPTQQAGFLGVEYFLF